MDFYEASRHVSNDDLSIVVAEHGDPEGEAVVMLHGWPDTADLWRGQVEPLSRGGFHVLAPDLRGRGRSASPDRVGDYRVTKSVGDVVAILDDAGIDRAHVVAHDWGAAVGWALAISAPDRVRSLVAVSVGHPLSFGGLRLEQMMRSWYMLLFQFEGVAEELLSRDDWAMFRRFVGNHTETESWIEELSRPGALTSSLNWYRANAHPERFLRPRLELPPVRVPVLGLWSTGDFALTERQMKDSSDYVDDEWRYERIEDASHWVPLDAPDLFNSLLLEWFGEH